MIEFSMDMRVEFYDTDCMGVVWNGTYFNYFERVRAALLRSVGYDYPRMYEEGFLLPVVRNKAKYIKALKLGDEFQIKATVTEYDLMLNIEYEISSKATGEIMTKGASSQMAVTLDEKSIGNIPRSLFCSFEEADR